MTVQLDHLWLILGLAAATLAFRLLGFFGGQALAKLPIAALVFETLPRLILAALVAKSLAGAPLWTWAIAAICFGIAIWTRNVLLTMLLGVGLALLGTLAFLP